jgi:GDPmannose 4,6-dehydratase
MKILLTGCNGQTGSWLAKHLVKEGHEVYGGIRRTSTKNLWRLDYHGITDKIKLVELDLLDYSNIYEVIKQLQPEQIFNFAAQSFVAVSFKQPISTCQVTGMSVLYMLDIIKTISPHTKFFQSSSSEMFGKVQEVPQKETTSFYPRSPYACAKLLAHSLVVNYRESYNLFGCSGIMFNNESQLRGPEFVTRKISHHVAKHYFGSPDVLELGNLDSRRDWGHSEDTAMGVWLMMQHTTPDTFVLATGEMHTVREFVEKAFNEIEEEVFWEGTGVDEVGRNGSGEIIVRVNPEFYRPADVDQLCGDATKAKTVLGWRQRYTFDDLVKLMVEADINFESVKV